MNNFGLYQGYPFNKNKFFAPSIRRRVKTPESKRCIKVLSIPKSFIERMTTPIPHSRKQDLFNPNPRDVITPETLSYHVYRNSLTSGKSSKRNYYSTTNKSLNNSSNVKMINFERHNFNFKSRDVAIQNVSIEEFQFPTIHCETIHK